MRLDLTPLDDAMHTTSHTYNAGKAQMVFESLPDFLREAGFLRDQLQQRGRIP